MTEEKRYPSYVVIWGWLVFLLFAALAFAFFPIGKATAIFLVFTVAAVKAYLVARHYMHLRSESFFILAIAGIPVLLLVGMVLALVPDIVFNR